MTPWWIVGRLLERSVWVVAALLLWASAGFMTRAAARLWPSLHPLPRINAFDVVGRLMIAVPLLWVLASWLVLAGRITLAGTWDVDGEMFTTMALYNSTALGYLPWAGGGVMLLALSQHIADG
jgi:hypothetical protein